MLTPYDIQWMETEVRQIIKGWHLRLEILDPVPSELQIGWNNLMHEYGGSIAYVQYINVIAERKDIQDKNTYDLNIRDGAGNKDDGRLLFTVSDLYTFINLNCIVLYDGMRWKIDMLKERIGETLVLISKVTGSNEKWEDEPVTTIDMEESSGA